VRWKALLIFGIVFLVLVIVPESQGVSVRDSPQLYSLYIDWLQGKPVGLLNVNIKLQESLEDPAVLIVDYTDKARPRVVYSRKGYEALEASLKIPRIPVKVVRDVTKEGIQEKTLFKPRTYVVIVSGKNKWDARILRITPERPITRATIKMSLSPARSFLRPKYSPAVYEHEYLGEDDAYVDVAKVYSVRGIRVAWHMPLYGTVGIDSFKKSWMTNDRWVKLGVEYPISYVDRQITAEDGGAKTVKAHVYYRCDKYTTCGNIWCNEGYIMTPVRINGFYGSSTSNPLGAEHPNSAYVEYVREEDEYDNYFQVAADNYANDGGKYLTTPSISLTFGAGPVSISFSGSIDSYRSSDSEHPRPYFDVWIKTWKNHRLYYWWMKESPARVSSKATYEVGFSWS